MNPATRPRETPQRRGSPGFHPWLPRLLAVTLCLWLLMAAAAGATSPRVAEPALARLLDGLTGTADLLHSQEAGIREAATKAAPGVAVEVPGFPVRGVGLPREEVLAGSPEQWRRALLDRSAALLYRDGTRPFAERPDASGFETGGGAWALSLLGGRLHDWFALLRWPPALATLALITGVLATAGPVRRWRVLGLALVAGAAVPVLLAAAVILVTRFAGGPTGTLSGEAAAVIAILARGPLIEGGAVALGGLVLWWWARRPVSDDDPAMRIAAARADRDARRRLDAGMPPEPRRPRGRFVDSDRTPD